jgi:DNA-binding FrmR family transcriptional regulator
MSSKSDGHRPVCMVAHDLLNKLSAIVGQCDLLNEVIEQGTDCASRLAAIRDIADAAVKELIEHQRRLQAEPPGAT